MNYRLTQTFNSVTTESDRKYRPLWLWVEYQYRPLNFLNIFVSSNTHFQVDRFFTYDTNAYAALGYRLSPSSLYSITPFGGISCHLASIPGKQTDIEMTTSYISFNVGTLVEYYATEKLTIGIEPIIQFPQKKMINVHFSNHDMDILNRSVTQKNKMIAQLSVPISYQLKTNMAFFGKFIYHKDVLMGEKEQDQFQLGLGLSNLF